MSSKMRDLARKSGDRYINSNYFDKAESHMRRQWNYYVWPYIQDFLRTNVLDLAAGYGRNTEFLKDVCNQVIVSDINQGCLDYCRGRFKDDLNLSYFLLDGYSLEGIEEKSIALIYSFDSMVHFEPEVVESYIKEFQRVLVSGGHGFIHHSNYLGAQEDFTFGPHWRNRMSKEIFKSLLEEVGLEVVSQRVIGWDESCLGSENVVSSLDCISIFTKR